MYRGHQTLPCLVDGCVPLDSSLASRKVHRSAAFCFLTTGLRAGKAWLQERYHPGRERRRQTGRQTRSSPPPGPPACVSARQLGP